MSTVTGDVDGVAAPGASTLRRDALRGLRSEPKTLPCKYFYDAAGSELFERICDLEAYYPTRTELSILQARLPEMAELIGPACRIVEFGAGSGTKTRLLLEHLHDPVAYIPVEIAKEQLAESAAELARDFPDLEVLPVCADYTTTLQLPQPGRRAERTLIFFPGSTIGNFEPHEARDFLSRASRVAGSGGLLLIGVDMRKDSAVLERAYDDEEGVTAAFNLNLLHRLNREAGADFDVSSFKHAAPWNDEESRIEMHLVSTEDQVVHLAAPDGEPVRVQFAAGEPIVTEYSYKYTIAGFERIAGAAGFRLVQAWTDERKWFAELLFEVR